LPTPIERKTERQRRARERRGHSCPRSRARPSDGSRRPPPPSTLARSPSPSSSRLTEDCAKFASSPEESRGTAEGQPPRTGRLLRVEPRTGSSILLLVLGRGHGEGGRCQVGGVDPARRGGRGRGGAGEGAEAHLRRRGHARLPVRRLPTDLPPRSRPARQAGN
jgi:hypothetical protein